MNAADLPPVAEVLPHGEPMMLLDQIVEHRDRFTRCLVEVDASRLFREPDGRIPAWVGVEYMAQCIAAHGGLLAWARGEPVKTGLFLGSRRLVFRTQAFAPGQVLEVSAHHLRGETGLASFECSLSDAGGGSPLAEGRLNVYLLEDPETMKGDPAGE